MMPFFDTHTHLDYLLRMSGEPLSRLMDNAAQAGVQKILIVAVMAQDFETLAKMTAFYPERLYYGLGLHPLYIAQHTEADLTCLEQRLAQRAPACTAVAEIGLERGKAELLTPALWQKQQDFFAAQLSLAKRYALPVSLHSRKAHDQLSVFLKRADLPKCGVVHGFAGSYAQAKRFVDLGYRIGVGGVITYQRANKTRRTIAKLPLDALLLETDSPDMPVFGFQGRPNRPERIVDTFDALCRLRSESADIIAQALWQNSLALFA